MFRSNSATKSTMEQQEVLSIFHLSEQQIEQHNNSTSLPAHCGWCQPYIPGATTFMCEDCRQKQQRRNK
jgi:hypothetical protein